jgi:hypothetical protein
MKKYLLLLCIPMLAVFAGCKKTTQVVVPNKTITVNIAVENWGTVNQKNWIADIGVPEITDRYTQNGATLIYRKTNNRDYEQWPVVYQGLAYSYSIRNGRIMFNVNHADGQSAISRPEAMTFKVILIEAE